MEPDKILEIFFEKYPAEKYPKNTLILNQEDEPEGMYYLTGGYVRQYAKSPKGEILYLHVFRPGSCFPMMWLLTDVKHRYFYEAITPVSVKKAPAEAVMKLMDRHPEILEYFTERLLLGMNGLLTRLESLVLDTAYTKTALLFIFFARMFGKREGKKVYIDIPLSHQQIGTWIGTARETATLAAEALRRKGFIRYRNRRYDIPDLSALEKEISASRLL
jgi:CRP-like cAMP-binding protein